MITAHKIFVQLFHFHFYSHSHSHYDYDYDYMIIITIYIIKMETIFMNTENSKTHESHRFRLDWTDKLNLRNPKKDMDLTNLSIYYTYLQHLLHKKTE